MFVLYIFANIFLDPWAEAEGAGPWRQVQKACPEEGEGVRRWDDESSPGLQTQGLHGPQSQPQVCEEGGRQTGQGIKTPRTFSPSVSKLLWVFLACRTFSFFISLFNHRCLLVKTGVRTWRPCRAWRVARRCSIQAAEPSETLCEESCREQEVL